ncbi:MAG: alpha/beta hydrolase [Aliidiomarina sp.]|uniref:alpha/beta hydrolase n=1 Tax=Aliidiomarina sp. TaxID=1872439 RepID=UPI0025BE3D53|nr:alpha/beta hydrolase-fold protein [Aliidiomarina sp.]MCH8501975.1 alpha/beta hydrolase [Aliidiomarina sp.]
MKALILSVFLFSSVCAASTSFQFYSERLGEVTTVRVALPETYGHSSDYEYPLLLVMDGSTQFNHIAGNIEFMSTFAETPDMIVVGVSANSRLLNFTQTELEQFAGRSGGAENYTKFLFKELLPKLREDYRIASHITVTGHSLSGLYSAYLAINHTDDIQAAISISPSLWWDDFAILNDLANLTAESAKVRWFASMASEPDEMAEGFDYLEAALGKLTSTNVTWELRRFPDETHDSTPLIGNVMGLRSVFRGFNAVPQIEVKSLEQLHSYYADYAEITDYNLPMSVHQYNVYGLKAAYEGQLAWGVEILEAGIQSFPYSEILWDSLATAYTMNDNHTAALNASEKAVKFAEQHGSKYLSEILQQNSSLKRDMQ